MSEPRSFRRRPRTADEFIQAAETPESAPPEASGPLPWDAARSDVTKLYQLRLPEQHYLMLKYITARTPYSMHAFCLSALLEAIEAKAFDVLKSNQ